MKWTKWSIESIREIASKCPNVRHFHHYHRGAEKAAKRLGILDSLFQNKQKHSEAYSAEQITETAKKYSKRSELQLSNPSMYNAAKSLGLLSKIYPIQLNKKLTIEELTIRANRYTTRADLEAGDPKAYQVIQKRGLLDEICPPKMQGLSRAEIELLEFLKTLVPDFKSKRFANDYELDCYSETLKLGVEYNGLYWHSDTNKHKNYHYKKTKYFESLGIRVIHIWEHEWRDRKGPVQNYLSSACKVNTLRLGARKCEFVELDSKEARRFLDKTHIQGAPRDIQLAIGAMWQGTLVSVATFGRHHRQGFDHVKVLNRFSCLPGVTVSGGLAKMTKLAYKKLGKLISWAHYAKSQAGGYLAAGWVIVKAHGPDYFYADDQGRVIPKQSRRKNSIDTPKGMTEIEHARLDGLYRVWDCGKILLEYDPGKKLIKIT